MKIAYCAIPALVGALAMNAHAQIDLKSTTGHELGLTLSKYRYTESDVLLGGTINQMADKVGVDYSYVHTLPNDWLLRADARYADGKADYTFNGTTLNGIKDWYFDV